MEFQLVSIKLVSSGLNWGVNHNGTVCGKWTLKPDSLSSPFFIKFEEQSPFNKHLSYFICIIYYLVYSIIYVLLACLCICLQCLYMFCLIVGISLCVSVALIVWKSKILLFSTTHWLLQPHFLPLVVIYDPLLNNIFFITNGWGRLKWSHFFLG